MRNQRPGLPIRQRAPLGESARPGSVESATGIGFDRAPVPLEGTPSERASFDAIPYDFACILRIPAIIVFPITRQLIGPAPVAQAVAFSPQVPPIVPPGYVMRIEGVSTYAETPTGALPPGRIPTNGAGTTNLTWTATASGRPPIPGGMKWRNLITATWDDRTPDALAYFNTGDQLIVTLDMDDSDHLYPIVGVRVRATLLRTDRPVRWP